MLNRIVWACLGVAVVLVLVAAGALLFVYQQASQPWQGPAEYVALGSSYASGPFLTRQAPHSPIFCARSNDNYAHQVARDLGLHLVDMSCAGATTAHVLRGGQFFQGPQLRPIDAGTRLITVTIGGNDAFYLGNLVAESCDRRTPVALRLLGACKIRPAPVVDAGLAAAARNLTVILETAHRRAPDAKILVMTYLTVLPPGGTCPALSLLPAQADQMRAVAQRLAQITKAAAAAAGATLIDVASLSEGHDVCSAAPWVAPAHPTTPHMAALHPTLVGMAAITLAIERALKADRPTQHVL